MNRLKHIVIPFTLCAVVFILFGKTLNNGFNSDDYLVLYHASQSRLAPVDAIKEFFSPSWGLYYRPLITIFFDVSEKRFGSIPTGYHLLGLLFYAFLCVEVYILGLLLTKKKLSAFAASLIFMTMIAHAEAIFWISSLNGVVENVFSLASLICFIQWKDCRRLPLYLASMVLFLAAVFLKESAVCLPLILVLYDILLGGAFAWPEMIRRPLRNIWPFLLITIAFVVLRWSVMKQISLPPPLTSFNLRTALLGSWQVFLMTLSPIDWFVVVNRFSSLEVHGFIFYLLAALPLLLAATLPLFLRKFRLLFLLGWIFSGIAPIILLGLVPSERHVILSSAGTAILLAVALFAATERLFTRNALAAKATASCLVLILSVTGFFYLNQRRLAWKIASDIADSVVAQTVMAHPSPQSDETLFFLNVPDTHEGAFIFRFANLTYALRLAYNQPSVTAIRIITPDRLPAGINGNGTYAYFRIAAMGGNISLANVRNKPGFSFLSRNPSFINDWTRYRVSPFLIYSRGRLIPSSPEHLRAVLQDLYSLN